MKIGVLIITFGRPAMLDTCIKSILANSVPPWEILVGINGEDTSSYVVLAEKGVDRLRVVHLPALSRGEARNRLLDLSATEIAVFLDDDVVVPDSYFAELEKLAAEYPECAVFGGGQIEGDGRNFFEKISYKTLCSFWGSGVYRKRFTTLQGTGIASSRDLILCNMAVRTEFLRRNGIKFPGCIASAEENYLLDRIERADGKMIISGRLNVFHRHRRNIHSYISQVFSFGRGRGQFFAATRRFFSFSALPPLFALLLCFLLLWMPVMAAVLIFAYLLADFFSTLAVKGKLIEKICVFFLIPLTHSTYAVGVAAGVVEELFSGKTRRSF